MGCNACFLKGEQHCPCADKVQPIAQALEWADVVLLDTPNYAMDISGAMQNLLDHLCYRWVTHRPHPGMFSKIGVVVCSSAGASPSAALKSLSAKLTWMCVGRVYRFPLIGGAMGPNDLSPKKRQEMDEKAEKLAQKIRRAAVRPRPRLRTKFFFLLFRNMQKSAAASWNPTDHDWWEQQGWLAKVLPWRR